MSAPWQFTSLGPTGLAARTVTLCLVVALIWSWCALKNKKKLNLSESPATLAPAFHTHTNFYWGSLSCSSWLPAYLV
ncbi:hypothetical protein B0H14DRAFT_2801169 [Mycena olivaceomarginata]|nr:hypothetical protein B0H14DRAFT_2801169 [Mycena olivaceomarginata]